MTHDDCKRRDIKALYLAKRGFNNIEVAEKLNTTPQNISRIKQENNMAKHQLTKKDHAKIIRLYAVQHVPQREIADMFNISRTQVQRILYKYRTA